MKRIISLLLAIIVLMGTAVIAEDKITVIINGCTLESDTSPVIVEGRTLLPVRAICEAVGANVSFDNETRTVTAKGYDYTLVLKIGDNSIKLYIGSDDFLESQCDVPPMIIDGRTFLPLRALCEAPDSALKEDEETDK